MGAEGKEEEQGWDGMRQGMKNNGKVIEECARNEETGK